MGMLRGLQFHHSLDFHIKLHNLNFTDDVPEYSVLVLHYTPDSQDVQGFPSVRNFPVMTFPAG